MWPLQPLLALLTYARDREAARSQQYPGLEGVTPAACGPHVMQRLAKVGQPWSEHC